MCILTLISLIQSCKSVDNNLPTEPNKLTVSKKSLDSTSTPAEILSKIQPMRMYMKYGSIWSTFDHWYFDHYGVKSGKTVGIWPEDYSSQNLFYLRTHYGFSKIIIAADQTKYNNAISAGYTLNNIMIALTDVSDVDRTGYINNFGNVYAYYVDEPADQNNSMGAIRNAILVNNFNSLYIISGYKRTDGLNYCVQFADKVMFSSYHHWWELYHNIWVSLPEDDDQRPDWSDMQLRYGSKFSMTWINSYEIAEFDYLFGHAQNLGLEGVWIYAPDSHQTDQYDNITAAAYAHGFLRRYYRQWKYDYKCISPEGTSTFPPGIDWQLVACTPTDNINEQ